eukprot:Gb_31072 [translate_table: standard]
MCLSYSKKDACVIKTEKSIKEVHRISFEVFFGKMTKNKRLPNIMVQDFVKDDDEPPAYEIMRLRNLNIFLYKEIMRLRIGNKSLVERMDRIGSIAKDEPKARRKANYKPQGWSLWKSWNASYHDRVQETKGVLVKEDPLTDVQVSQEDGIGGWLQCEDQNT